MLPVDLFFGIDFFRIVDEIGKHLNISSKAAESVLSRARAAFKDGFRSLWDFEPDFLLK